MNYKKLFLIRFFGYSGILIGLSVILFEFGPLFLSETTYRINLMKGVNYVLEPQVITSAGQNQPQEVPESGLGSILNTSETLIKPVSTDYGIVIEKINANAKIMSDIDPTNPKQYEKALQNGVAEALGSTKPGEPGNLFIFSHSANSSLNIVRFNAIFYLLRELVNGDRVVIFYQGKRFDYIVFNKQVVRPDDVSFLRNRYDAPVLTLQTCDPPGTLNNRLIVQAKLAGT